jgi:hypothetical protein
MRLLDAAFQMQYRLLKIQVDVALKIQNLIQELLVKSRHRTQDDATLGASTEAWKDEGRPRGQNLYESHYYQ